MDQPTDAPGLTATPPPPYYAVIFASVHADDLDGYAETARLMNDLAARQPGFLGVDSARDDVGITVSYWTDEAAIRAWREHTDHALARRTGRARWYDAYTLRVARVERAHEWARGRDRPGSEPSAPGGEPDRQP